MNLLDAAGKPAVVDHSGDDYAYDDGPRLNRRERRRAKFGRDRRAMLVENDARRLNQRARRKVDSTTSKGTAPINPVEETLNSGLVVPTNPGKLWTPTPGQHLEEKRPR